MATRSLGTLTLDLVAKIGGFTAGMTQAERVADQKTREIARKSRERAKSIEKTWSGVGKAITASIAGISIGGAMAAIIRNTIDAEKAQAQLAAVLNSTGNAAGFSQQRLNEMGAALAQVSTFSIDGITDAQTTLLAFTGIVGEQLPKALQSAMDMSTRTGMSLRQAAETIGRALDVPSQGLSALSRQGFRFTEDQKKLAQELEATGRAAEAQQIVLDALKESYGGAAEAAVNTYGGAMQQLKNTINDLLTGKDGSFDEAIEAVHSLNRTLSSSDTRAAFSTFIRWTVELANTVIKASANIVAFMTQSNKLALLTRTDPLSQATRSAKQMSRSLEGVVDNIARLNSELEKQPNNKVIQQQLTIARAQYDDLAKAAFGATGKVKELASTLDAPKVKLIETPDLTPRASVVGGGAGKPKGGGSSKQQRDSVLEAGKQYIEQLQRQIALGEKATEVEKVLYELQHGRLVGLNGVMADHLTDLAKQIDATRQQKELAEALESVNIRSLELQGKLGAAAAARFDKENEQIRKALEAAGKLDELSQLDRLREHEVAQARINKLMQEYQQITGDLQIQEDRIAISQQVGALGELDALQRIGEERQQAIAQMRTQLALFEAMNDAALSDEQRQQIERLRLELEKLEAVADPLADKFNTVIKDSFSNAFADFITGTKSAKEAFRAFANSVMQEMARMMAQQFATKIFSSFAGSFAGSIPSFDVGTPYVPRDTLAMVHKGERILTADENRDFMKGGDTKIINVMDPSVVGDYLGTDAGESLIINVMQRNRQLIGV